MTTVTSEPVIVNAAGHVASVWSWKPDDAGRIGPESGWSGISPVTSAGFAAEVERRGHAILRCSSDMPANHRIAGIGVGHDDAEFAESGRSHAAYVENGEPVFGRWWERPGGGARYFGLE